MKDAPVLKSDFQTTLPNKPVSKIPASVQVATRIYDEEDLSDRPDLKVTQRGFVPSNN